MDKNITIGQRYLREGIKRDYNNWRFAWVREVGQNSLDAGATEIHCSVVFKDNNTYVVWNDNGCGMTADIVENKFMAIGESGKENSGVGGFGIAGALIAFAQLNYSIRTNDILVKGSGSRYGIQKIEGPPIKGVVLTVAMEGNESFWIKSAIREWINFTTTKATFYLNGEKVNTLRMHKPKAETEWCKIYTYRNMPPGYDYFIRVRMNGQLMHSRWTSFETHVVVDLTGESLDYLTSNRDSLKGMWGRKLDELVQELYEDPNKIRAANDHTTFWRGKEGLVKLGADRSRKVSKMSLAAPIISRPSSLPAALAITATKAQVKPVYEARSLTEIQTLIDGHDVVVLNQTNKEIPAKWLPGTMNKHAYKLLNRWIRVIKACGQLMDRRENVSVGWVFSHEARALHKYSSEHGHMILLNPVSVKETKFTNYWDNSNASFYKLVAVAVHELCHIDYGAHNTAFANKITYEMGKVMSRPSVLGKVKSQTKL